MVEAAHSARGEDQSRAGGVLRIANADTIDGFADGVGEPVDVNVGAAGQLPAMSPSRVRDSNHGEPNMQATPF